MFYNFYCLAILNENRYDVLKIKKQNCRFVNKIIKSCIGAFNFNKCQSVDFKQIFKYCENFHKTVYLRSGSQLLSYISPVIKNVH